MQTTGELLGLGADERRLILTADLLGSCHAANLGCYAAVRDGIATGTSLMVPAPWARDAAANYRGEGVGVHLTLNAEHDRYRWRPLTHAPSLYDGDGGFPRTTGDLWDHADLDEARLECRAQLERAVLWGFEITHLSTHLNALQNRPEFFDIYLDLAVEYRLPVRLEHDESSAGFPFRSLAAAEGIAMPDRVVFAPHDLAELVERIEPGVTEVVFSPAVDTPEARAVSDDWAHEQDWIHQVAAGAAFAEALTAAGIELMNYRELRDAQRCG